MATKQISDKNIHIKASVSITLTCTDCHFVSVGSVIPMKHRMHEFHMLAHQTLCSWPYLSGIEFIASKIELII